MTPRLLDAGKVAEILGVTQERFYQMAREGIVPVVKMGRQIRVDAYRLEQWIASGGQAYAGGWKKEA